VARALGGDAAGKHGWVGVLVDDDGFADAALGSLDHLIGWAGPVDAIGIDIPIGNVPGGRRLADAEARRFIGGRGSSVFSAPPSEILAAATYAAANEALVELGSSRISQQAWALIPKMVEAAEIAAADGRVVEVHPEVSFCALAGEHLPWSKKTWNGLLLRRRLLAEAGIAVPDVLPAVGRVVADDVVDAAAAAWSARRVARGEALSLPDQPQRPDGRDVAIWY